MDSKLQFFLILAILVYLIIIIILLKRKRLNLKYTLLWIFAAAILLIVTIFPSTIYYISSLIGIETPINSALVIAGMFVMLILIVLTSIVSGLNQKLRVLIQEVGVLEKKIRDLSEDMERK